MQLDLYLTPFPFARARAGEKTVVVIDVLRSSTSTCAALLAGARGVIPARGPGEAGEIWAKLGGDIAVLAGERDGVKIENFSLGNSPAEFTRESVGDKYVVMTTTNGTAVYDRTQGSPLVLCAGLVNISGIASRVARENRDVVAVCAGKDGGFSIEDTICAGMMIHLLEASPGQQPRLNDAGSLALLLYRTSRKSLVQTIRQGEHGRRLTEIGFANDVEISAAADSMPIVPVLRDGRLVADASNS